MSSVDEDIKGKVSDLEAQK